MYNYQTKLAGGRWWAGIKATWLNASQPFGGAQGGGGLLFGSAYSPGGVIDHLLETFAGPHDWLNSFQYNAPGELKLFFQSGFGNVLGELSGAATLAPAAVFATASVAPELAYIEPH